MAYRTQSVAKLGSASAVETPGTKSSLLASRGEKGSRLKKTRKRARFSSKKKDPTAGGSSAEKAHRGS